MDGSRHPRDGGGLADDDLDAVDTVGAGLGIALDDDLGLTDQIIAKFVLDTLINCAELVITAAIADITLDSPAATVDLDAPTAVAEVDGPTATVVTTAWTATIDFRRC